MKKIRKFSKLAIFSILGLFLLVTPFAVMAGSNQSIYIAEDEIVEGNFIKIGNTINIAGNVNGDVIVAGSSITISGDVAGDVIAVGSIIRITGEVGGSVRVAGSAIEINGEVKHNIWAVGSTVAINEDASVGWDVFSAGASVEIRGPVERSVWLAGASLVIDNKIGKDVNVAIDQEGQLTLSPQAEVGGQVVYKAAKDEQLVQNEGAVVTGEIIRKDLNVPNEKDLEQFFGTAYVMFKIFTLFSLLLIGLVYVTLVPKATLMIKDEMIKNPLPSLGYGFVYLVLMPIVILALFITIIGIPLALILIPIYVISLIIAKVFAAFVIGVMILDKATKNKYKKSLVWPLVLGLVVFVIVTSIPVIGWIAKLLLVLWALGGLIKIKKEILKEYR